MAMRVFGVFWYLLGFLTLSTLCIGVYVCTHSSHVTVAVPHCQVAVVLPVLAPAETELLAGVAVQASTSLQAVIAAQVDALIPSGAPNPIQCLVADLQVTLPMQRRVHGCPCGGRFLSLVMRMVSLLSSPSLTPLVLLPPCTRPVSCKRSRH